MFSLTLVCEPITDVRAKDWTEIILCQFRPSFLSHRQRIHYETKRIDSGSSDFKNETIIS